MGDRAGVGCGFLIAGIGGGFEAFPKGLLARGLPLQGRKGVSAPRARNQGNIHQSEGRLGPSGIIQCGHEASREERKRRIIVSFPGPREAGRGLGRRAAF